MDLNNLRKELAQYENIDQDQLLLKHVEKRLNKSLRRYVEDLKLAKNYVMTSRVLDIHKELNK